MIDPITKYILNEAKGGGMMESDIHNPLYDKYVFMAQDVEKNCYKFKNDPKKRVQCLNANFKRLWTKWSSWAKGETKKICNHLSKVYADDEPFSVPPEVTLKKCYKYAASTTNIVKKHIRLDIRDVEQTAKRSSPPDK